MGLKTNMKLTSKQGLTDKHETYKQTWNLQANMEARNPEKCRSFRALAIRREENIKKKIPKGKRLVLHQARFKQKHII